MNTDIRLSTEFWDHPKTVKLERRLGLQGPKSLQILWAWAAKNHADGSLKGEDVEAIEIAAKWPGEEGKFVETLLSLRWLDQEGDAFFLHDWEDHNSWAAEADSRSDAARLSRLARVNKEAADGIRADGRSGITKDEYRLYAEGTPYQRRTTVPTTPTPAPTLRKEKDNTTPLPPVAPAAPGLEPYSLEFLEFWDAYPNKEAQDDAWIAWLELKKGRKHPGLSVLQDAICVQEQGERWQDTKFIPSPGAWLRKGRWKDQPPPKAPARASPPGPHLTPRQKQTEMFKGMAQALKRTDGAGNGENNGGRRVEGALPAGAALPRS